MTYIFFRLRHPKHEKWWPEWFPRSLRAIPRRYRDGFKDADCWIRCEHGRCSSCYISVCTLALAHVSYFYIYIYNYYAHATTHIHVHTGHQTSTRHFYPFEPSEKFVLHDQRPVSDVSSVFASICTCACSSFVRPFSLDPDPTNVASHARVLDRVDRFSRMIFVELPADVRSMRESTELYRVEARQSGERKCVEVAGYRSSFQAVTRRATSPKDARPTCTCELCLRNWVILYSTREHALPCLPGSWFLVR